VEGERLESIRKEESEGEKRVKPNIRRHTWVFPSGGCLTCRNEKVFGGKLLGDAEPKSRYVPGKVKRGQLE